MEFTQSKGLTPKMHILLIGMVLVILNTALSSLSPEGFTATENVLIILCAVGFNVLSVFWCFYDSRERSETLSPYFTFAVVVFGVLALFYYFFKSRGFRSGLILTGKFIVLFFGTSLVSAVIFAAIATLSGQTK